MFGFLPDADGALQLFFVRDGNTHNHPNDLVLTKNLFISPIVIRGGGIKLPSLVCSPKFFYGRLVYFSATSQKIAFNVSKRVLKNFKFERGFMFNTFEVITRVLIG